MNVAAIADWVSPMMRKMGNFVDHGLGMLSPIDLAAKQGWHRTIASEAADVGVSPGWAVAGGFFGMHRSASRQYAEEMAKNPALKPYSVGDWFRGMTYTDKMAGGQQGFTGYSSDMMKAMSNRSWARGAVAGAVIGTPIASAMFGEDSLVSRMGMTGRNTMMHAGLSVGLSRMVSPLAGAMYAGWAGVNAFRKGNQFGPF